MGFKKKLKKKLKGIIKSYEDGSELGEYAKGRLANTKMILDIVKKMDYIPCCTEFSGKIKRPKFPKNRTVNNTKPFAKDK